MAATAPASLIAQLLCPHSRWRPQPRPMAAFPHRLPAPRLGASLQDGGIKTSGPGGSAVQDGGVREAESGRRPGIGGGQRAAGTGTGSAGGWRAGGGQRGGVPAASRRHGHGAGGAAQGAGGAARRTRVIPGRVLRAVGAGGGGGGTPGTASAPGPGAVVRVSGSSLAQDGLRQQHRRGLRGAGLRRAAAGGGRGRAALQRAAEADLPARGGPGRGGGRAAPPHPVPRPRGRPVRRVPLRRPHLLRAAGVRGQSGCPVRRAGRRGLGGQPAVPGGAAGPGGRAGSRARPAARLLPGGGLQAGPRQAGTGHGPGAAGEEDGLLHEQGGVPEQSHGAVHSQGEACGVMEGGSSAGCGSSPSWTVSTGTWLESPARDCQFPHSLPCSDGAQQLRVPAGRSLSGIIKDSHGGCDPWSCFGQ